MSVASWCLSTELQTLTTVGAACSRRSWYVLSGVPTWRPCWVVVWKNMSVILYGIARLWARESHWCASKRVYNRGRKWEARQNDSAGSVCHRVTDPSARPIYRSHMCHVCGVKPSYGVTKDGRLAIVLAESNCIRCVPEGLPTATYVTGIQYLVTLPSVRKSASVIACIVFNLHAYAQRGYSTCCGLAVANVNGLGICSQKVRHLD